MNNSFAFTKTIMVTCGKVGMNCERQIAKPVANHRDALAKEAWGSRAPERNHKTEIARSRQRYRGMESDLKMNKLRNDCSELRSKIGALEAAVREISTDPDKNLPMNVDRKKQLPKLKLQLRRCVGKI